MAWVSRAALLSRFCLRLPWGCSMETRESLRLAGRGPGCAAGSLLLGSVSLSLSPSRHPPSPFPYLFVSASVTCSSPSSPLSLFTPHRFPFEARASLEGLAGTEARGHPAESRLRWVDGAAQAQVLSNCRGPERPRFPLPGQGALTGCAGLLCLSCPTTRCLVKWPSPCLGLGVRALRTVWTVQPFSPSSEGLEPCS